MRRSKRGTSGSAVDLNVVIIPFLDMSFQILFFLIISFKPASVEEGQIDFNLPAAGEAKATMPENVDPTMPSDKDLALPANLTVELRANAFSGELNGIMVESLDGTQYSIEGAPAKLEGFLKDRHADLENKEDIKIKADSKLKYVYVIQVMDACLNAGFKSVGFPPPADLN